MDLVFWGIAIAVVVYYIVGKELEGIRENLSALNVTLSRIAELAATQK